MHQSDLKRAYHFLPQNLHPFPKCFVTIKIQHNLLSVSIPVLPFNVGHVIYANESPAQHLHIHSVFLNFLDLDPEFFTYVLDILSYSIWSLTFRVCCSIDTLKENIKCRTWAMLTLKTLGGIETNHWSGRDWLPFFLSII